MGHQLNEHLWEGLDPVGVWLQEQVLNWYDLGGWVAFFLAAGLALLVWRMVKRSV